MHPRFPRDIEECIRKAAKQFGEDIEALEYPNKGKDAPATERTVLLNVCCFLHGLDHPYHLYSEGSFRGGRVDLMGFNGEVAFVLEAKVIGNIKKQAESAIRDLDRMLDFSPEISDVAEGVIAHDWWVEAKERWGIVLIASFRGKEIAEAWQSESEDLCTEKIRCYSRNKQSWVLDLAGGPAAFLRLHSRFSPANRGAVLVTTAERWKDAGQVWLLWGGVPLS